MATDTDLNMVRQKGDPEEKLSTRVCPLSLCVAFAGLHSILLGLFIFFFTKTFYSFFFGTAIENFFFVKQSGLFLVCLGCFYLVPVFDLEKYNLVVIVIIATKVLAVGFLILHTSYTPRPWIILLAAIIDAFMAVLLAYSFIRQMTSVKE